MRATELCAAIVLTGGLVLWGPGVTEGATPDGPYWGELALPAGASGFATAKGTTVVLDGATEVHLWSGITRKWTVLPTSGGHVISVFNAFAVIEDGNNVHAFSSRSGAVATLALSGPPTSVVIGSSSAHWVALVLQGTDVWGFGAFHGQWVKQTIGSTTPSMTLHKVTALVHDGADAYGFNAYDGTWSSTPAPGSPLLEALGFLAVANDPTVARCYSALSGAWTVFGHPNTASMIMNQGFALFIDGTNLTAFSGFQGTVATATTSTSGFVTLDDRHVMMIVDGDEVTCYASGPGLFDTQTFSSPTMFIQDDLAVVSDSTGVTGFSGVTGTYSATVPGTFSVSTNKGVAYATGAGSEQAYSVVQNAWFPAPVSGATVELVLNAAVIVDSSGYHAFAGRTGLWHSLTSSSPASYTVNTSGDLFAGQEGNKIHLFDPRIGRWATKETALPAPVNLFRTVTIANDGSTAYGFGLMNNAWDQIDMQGTVTFVKASSSCAVIQTDTHLYTYTAHGSFSTLSRFPEFSRYQPQTDELRVIQAAPAGSMVLTILGVASDHLPMGVGGALGTLFVDITPGLVLFPLGTVPAGDLLDLSVTLPPGNALNGISLHIQNFVTDPTGKRWLTNSISPVIH